MSGVHADLIKMVVNRQSSGNNKSTELLCKLYPKKKGK